MMKTAGLLFLLFLANSARAGESGVLFYAGFDGTADAAAAGNGAAHAEEGAPQFRPGKRGQALLSGENVGYVSYAVANNIHPERGSIELWVCPQDWAGTDDKFHVFFEAAYPGWLLVYKYQAPGAGTFLISENHESWGSVAQDFGRFRPGEWHHLVATWSPRKICFYLDGKPSAQLPRPPIPAGLVGRFLVGDRPWQIARSARSLVDELYIYDRPLNDAEVTWAYEHAADRAPGADLPAELGTPVEIMVRPFPSRREIRVDVELNLRGGAKRVRGEARLEPSAGTAPAPVRMTAKQTGFAVIPFRELPAGDYQVVAAMRDERERIVGAASAKLTSPGPPVWRGNKIGRSDTPPPPWTPLTVATTCAGSGRSEATVSCWGRDYRVGPRGLLAQVTSGGRRLLASPLEMRITARGKAVVWRSRPLSVVEQTATRARIAGSAESELGTLEWTCTAEFDGMLRYDLTLRPARGAVADAMELRVPLSPARATLQHIVATSTNTSRGAVPAGTGAVFKANWAMYWWLGDEDCGLAGFCESDEAWDRVDRGDGFRIERRPQSVDAVWSFRDSSRELRQPWRFTFGLQATPVKDITGWRKWRLEPAENANISVLWALPDVIRYFGYPQATDPEKYKTLVKEHHADGLGVTPYSLLNAVSSQAPEWSLYGEEWANGTANSSSSDVAAYKAPIYGCSPAPDWADFIVWANERYVRELDLDGLYHDFTQVMPSANRESGCGYLRDGKVRPTYPIFATREIYKRVYIMLKDYGRATDKDTFMMGHMSSQMVIPLLSFCDAYLDGEHFAGLVKDNYLEVMPLDQIRAEFMGRNWGVMPFFLPEFSGEFLKKAEATQHLVGLSLLNDFALWPVWFRTDEANRVYRALDEFDMVDAELLPYWNNGDVIGGQSDAVKCTAYREPGGGVLLCLVNLTRQPQRATLTIDWRRLVPNGRASVVDAIAEEPVSVQGESVTVEIQPLNFRLLRVRSADQRPAAKAP